jgi:hypothetical protein
MPGDVPLNENGHSLNESAHSCFFKTEALVKELTKERN